MGLKHLEDRMVLLGQEIGVHEGLHKVIWVVVKIMVPFWIPVVIRPLIFGVPKKGP